MPTRIRVQRERIQRSALEAFGKTNFNNSIMQVGIVEDQFYEDGTSLMDVVLWNEFGTDDGHVPERAALRTAVKKAAPGLAKLGAQQAKLMLQGKLRFDVAARRLAKILRDEMIGSVERWKKPPNAPSTIERKGFDDPLIETGLYINSISYKLLKTRKDQL